jgi:hypothetical protein
MNNDNLPLGFFQDYNPEMNEMRKQLVKNIIKTNVNEESNLEQIFFSDDNIELINKQLVLTIWKKTNKKYLIGFQNKDQIIIIMRYVFLENARHLPYNIKGQIKDLNCNVVAEMYPSVITNFEQKLGYLRDIETRGKLPDLPKSTTYDKTLPSNNNSDIFH